GFGRLAFPNASTLRAWRKERVRSEAWSDWPESFPAPSAKPFVVGPKLDQTTKPRRDGGVLGIEVNGTTVELTMDVGEESFNDEVGEVATLLRAAAAHGAKGTLLFLGTGGAEGDFAYRLVLARGRSRLVEIERSERREIYRGASYKAFVRRVADAA